MNGNSSLENKILNVLDQVGEDVKLIIAGDFNARTGNECDYIECDYSEYIVCGSCYTNDHFEGYRKSKDKVVNTFGHCLLDMYRNLNIHFVNGRTGKDIDGEFTIMSAVGCRVIDYFIISSELFTHVKDFEILYVDISDHFPLLYTIRLSNADSENFVTDCVNNHEVAFFYENEILDSSITYNEIFKAIMSMSNGKAPGPDSIIIEMLKAASHMLCPIMLSLYNKTLDTGCFPEFWCEAVICPLYKNGDKNDVENDRGISLLNVFGKIFTKVLNRRLVSYVEVNNMFYEEQAGYRSDYSTIENIFILQSVVLKYITKQKGRMYCIFVDFSKAFDSVQHNLLYFTLIKNGIGGKVFKYFGCTIGVRQGCMVSPLLFIPFLNEYITMLKKNCKGIQIESITEVQTLLYADEMVNIADTIGGVNYLSVLNVLLILRRSFTPVHTTCNRQVCKTFTTNEKRCKCLVYS
uniref:Reverse transcriptase domain-containing protein n=1 Tax=Sinocyclocheilus grahami TaxID=75366 RepID=A0A672KW72_SINGR